MEGTQLSEQSPRGNFTEELERRTEELAQMKQVYSQIRERGMDLYTFYGGSRLAALPDASRAVNSRGDLELTKSDLRKISFIVKKNCVDSEVNKKTNLIYKGIYSGADEYDLARDGMRWAWRILDDIKQGGLTPFSTARFSNRFSLESLKDALEGKLPVIDYDNIDTT